MARLLEFFKKDSLSNRLDKIKQGDRVEREKLIGEYIPFIIKTVSEKTNRYIESENSEEYSIGLEAFNEAIDKYEKDKGAFISFAQLVIQSRITDYLRRMKKHEGTVPISQLCEEENQMLDSNFQTEDFTKSYDLKYEIVEFEDKLRNFHINFSDLVQEAPKHYDTRMNALRIARYIAEHPELKEELLRKKTLPGSRLIQELNVTLKILKRSRKFIIAAVLIFDSEFELLKQYISCIEGGAANDL